MQLINLAVLKFLTRTIWILSLVSLFTDAATEMLYPVMPVYLREIGFSVVLIGILEGIAEAVAGLSKGYFGKWSDHIGRRLPFIQWGYVLSTISKPMLAMFTQPLWVFFSRTIDRFGKGIRTGARDAMLSDEAKLGNKGRVFGFHRAMDTLGAVIGPMCALIYLHQYPGDYKTMFLLAVIPGSLAVLCALLLNEKKSPNHSNNQRPGFLSFLTYLKTSPSSYRKLMIGLLAYTLINSTDVFLLLKVKSAGGDDETVIQMYMLFNLVYALGAFPLGRLADQIGLKSLFVSGLILYGIVYAGMGLTTSIPVIAFLFILYGLHSAATEGISKAWISNVVSRRDTATAIGTFATFQSIFTTLASTIAGLIWFQFGANAPFLIAGFSALLIAVGFIFLIPYQPFEEVADRID